MRALTIIKANVLTQIEDVEAFEYYLAVSSDILMVVEKESGLWECVEIIVEGNDSDGTLLGFNTVNELLDAIIVIKNVLLAGMIPVFVG